MHAIMEIFTRIIDEMNSRFDGPLHFRFLIMPTVIVFLAIRAGLKDAREKRPVFLWAILTDSAHRKEIIRSGWKDIARIFIIAIVLDTIYQIIVLKAIYIIQALVIAVLFAMIPYALIRGPANRLMRRFIKKTS